MEEATVGLHAIRHQSWTHPGMTPHGRASSVQPAALWVLTALAALLFLRAARPLLIPIALGVLLSYALEPAVDWLERHRVHRVAGSAVVLLALLCLLAGAAYTLSDDVTRLVTALPASIDRLRDTLLAKLGPGGEALGEAVPQSDTTGHTASDLAGGSNPGDSQAPLQTIANATLTFAGQLVVIFFLIFFLLVSAHDVKSRLVEIAGPDQTRRQTAATIIDDINQQIQRYLLVLLLTAIIVGAATAAALAMLGTRNAIMWGALAGVLNSIPYLGPVVVSGGLFVVGLTQDGGVTQALQMSGAAIVITSLEGWLLTPVLMGKAERMSALAVFLGVLLWTWVWGPWGTVLAVPMLVTMKSAADHIDKLKPIGRLMAP
jgi:predicted PurR-regulated permease PerM